MSVKVNTSSTFTYMVPKVDSTTGEIELVEGNKRTVENPFINMLDMVDYYLSIVANQDIDSLKAFAKFSDSNVDAKSLSNLDMYQHFVLSMYWSSVDPVDDDEWLDFDHEKMDELLKNPFFDEYNRTLPVLKTVCKWRISNASTIIFK